MVMEREVPMVVLMMMVVLTVMVMMVQANRVRGSNASFHRSGHEESCLPTRVPYQPTAYHELYKYHTALPVISSAMTKGIANISCAALSDNAPDRAKNSHCPFHKMNSSIEKPRSHSLGRFRVSLYPFLSFWPCLNG